MNCVVPNHDAIRERGIGKMHDWDEAEQPGAQVPLIFIRYRGFAGGPGYTVRRPVDRKPCLPY